MDFIERVRKIGLFVGLDIDYRSRVCGIQYPCQVKRRGGTFIGIYIKRFLRKIYCKVR